MIFLLFIDTLFVFPLFLVVIMFSSTNDLKQCATYLDLLNTLQQKRLQTQRVLNVQLQDMQHALIHVAQVQHSIQHSL